MIRTDGHNTDIANSEFVTVLCSREDQSRSTVSRRIRGFGVWPRSAGAYDVVAAAHGVGRMLL
jgi:hypothetical protein